MRKKIYMAFHEKVTTTIDFGFGIWYWQGLEAPSNGGQKGNWVVGWSRWGRWGVAT